MAKKTAAVTKGPTESEPKGSPRRGPAAQEAPASRGPRSTVVDIALRRDARCGDQDLAKGTRIASVTLGPGVALNYVVDALRGGIAGEVNATSE